MSYVFHACLCSPDGTLSLPLQWGNEDTPCPWRFFPIQTWDDHEDIVAQPYADDPDIADVLLVRPSYELWMIDIWNPPPGWVLQPLDSIDFKDTQLMPQFKKWDHKKGEIVARAGFRRSPISAHVMLPVVPDGDHVCHWTAAGEPCLYAVNRSPRDYAKEGIRTCLQQVVEDETMRIAEEFHKVRPRAFSARIHRKVVSRGKQIDLVQHDLYADSPLDPRNRSGGNVSGAMVQ